MFSNLTFNRKSITRFTLMKLYSNFLELMLFNYPKFATYLFLKIILLHIIKKLPKTKEAAKKTKIKFLIYCFSRKNEYSTINYKVFLPYWMIPYTNQPYVGQFVIMFTFISLNVNY